ncbi:MAG TPA: PBP1A family penicillin-binding protein [Spirochaetia bacterium]|nr:PBP1A family penicillin-binding protein [Spirochaetia bacterium]
MSLSRRKVTTLVGFGIVATFVCVLSGILVGLGIANVDDLKHMENLGETRLDLPSQVLDRNGKLITEYVASEQRQLVKLDELPKYVIYALITREDQNFYHHHGFSVRGTLRAAWNLLSGHYVSGGSTLTQQLAGTLYADRAKFSIWRKLKELWWALNLERKLSKNEILQLYLNKMLFGPGVYGIEAASEFFFGHPAKELTVAEAAMLVIQLANPSYYNPFRFPNRARDRQKTVLDQMVKLGYATAQEVNSSFVEFWHNYDYTQSGSYVAQDAVTSKAPFFSEYVRTQLQSQYLLGTADIYRDGYVIHTTLDLDDQNAAETYFHSGLAEINSDYERSHTTRLDFASTHINPLIDLLSLNFNIPSIHIGSSKRNQEAYQDYQNQLVPLLSFANLMFMKPGSSIANAIVHSDVQKLKQQKQTTVQGALVTLDNSTGEILAMIGGADFERGVSEFNYAVDGRLQPGSSFKPLYYSAAVEKHVITPATMIQDSPIVYTNDNGTPYAPQNFLGEWTPPVLARTALKDSMNVPSIHVLSLVGFTDAFRVATRLLGIPQDQMLQRGFERRYPVGLGTVSVAPIEMARAYATIANLGREVIPIAIRYVEDRNGRIIVEPEKDTLQKIQRMGNEAQIITPQAAYIMQSMMHSTVVSGTLAWAFGNADLNPDYPIEFAGKTGTTQNWSSVWTMGFSPYMTTALWYGFDKPGRSLGVQVLGGATAGPIWARYMKAINHGMAPKQFTEPPGIVHMDVTAATGLLPPPGYKGEVIKEVFIRGTEPRKYDSLEQYQQTQEDMIMNRLKETVTGPDLALPRPASSGDHSVSTVQLPSLNLNLNLGNGSSSSSTPTTPSTNGNSAQPSQNNLLN